MKYGSKFTIENIPENPENLLKDIFDKCINQTVEHAKENEIVADHIGAIISSQLLDRDIYIPIRKIQVDTVDNILNEFLKVSQSKSDRGSLWGEPFNVVVHAIGASQLPTKKTIRGSAPSSTQQQQQQQLNNQENTDHLILVNNRDNYCLFHALELTRKHDTKELGHRSTFCRYHNQRLQQQHEDIKELMLAANIQLWEQDYCATIYVPIIVNYWNKRYEKEGFRFKVFVFENNGSTRLSFSYGDNTFNTPISIYHKENHFEGVRNVGALFGKGYKYCFTCNKRYRRAQDHDKSCKSCCLHCGRVGIGMPCPVINDFNKKCNECMKQFWNEECFIHHNKNNNCRRSKQCEKCGVIWNVKAYSQDPSKHHICGNKWCKNCNQFHNAERGCYIRPLTLKKPVPYRLITFDFESTQHEQLDFNNRLHQVNFIAATIICTECMEDENIWRKMLQQQGKFCRICGPHRNITFSKRPFFKTTIDHMIVTENPLSDFVQWIIFGLDRKYTTMAYSHFGGRYDMVMAFREIFLRGIVPSMIRRGNKLYQLLVPKTQKGCEVIFRDSFNLCPVALGRLVGAFGLKIQEKQFFPHLTNNPKNYDITLPALPPKNEYMYGSMSTDKQREFDLWYSKEKYSSFCLNEALAEYCTNDVQILTEALIEFRKRFLKISCTKNINEASDGIDILRESMTIASACMKHFRLNHLKPEHLAIVPEKGYDSCDTQSELALKYLEWYAEKNDVEIQTAHSPNGEKLIAGRFRVDGYIEEEDRAIEVHGCVWHACPKHFGDQLDKIMPNGKTVGAIRAADNERLEILLQNIRQVDVVWECDIKRMLSRDKNMRKAFKNYRDKGPIKIRDCFFGGRTGPSRMYFNAGDNYIIKYLDFNSLYPSTIATTSFPIGHPKIHIAPKQQQQVNWTRSEQIPYKGILKVFLVPPEKLEVPVMPIKFDDRLLFPLCRRCSLDFPRGDVIPNYSCPHLEDERGWVSTCTSLELSEALNEGYRVTSFYRALYYEKWDDQLFKNYVAEFMSMKIHASGFPPSINTPEKEDEFIEKSASRFGIQLKRELMIPDKAMRYISKLMLNSLWGRFSLRNTLAKSHVTNSPAELRDFLQNKSIQINSVDSLTNETILITYESIEEFTSEHETSNIILSLWTTSMARIHLLRAMKKVASEPNCTLLYGDTDSLLFAYPINQECPLKDGPYLGDLAEEYEDCIIKEYVGGACKAYGLRMLEKSSLKEKTVLRVRGITLSGDVCKKFHFDSFKDIVLKYGRINNSEIEQNNEEEEDNDVMIVNYPNFLKPNIKAGRVCSTELNKKFCPIILKGIVTKDYKIVDFGYK
ncbi:hypothetical protein Mgra_00001009 [Meloidogyne graminicola]|uniref:DNA-directed DNA polymerase n=1 Tax=Meloidogyne graminicola TaxID=189291 RepID=A0A8T0A2P5_9BILA|nr:hypothetical protein Mgra_00001009 [Meloidogyne graminicola]